MVYSSNHLVNGHSKDSLLFELLPIAIQISAT